MRDMVKVIFAHAKA